MKVSTMTHIFNPSLSKRLRIFCQHVGRGINRFDMIENDDRILIGISGGKDSLCLAVALKARLEWIPITYELHAVLIDWREYPLGVDEKEEVNMFFHRLDVPFRIIEASINPPSFKKGFNCYLCSRNKKRILFEEAQKLGVRKIALGHTLDDHIETTLMELCFRGRFASMMPVQKFFDGKMSIIRPMCEVKESEVRRFAERFQLPVVSGDCPNKERNQRRIIKEVVRKLSKHNRRVRENIYRAPWHRIDEYLPSVLETSHSKHP